MGYLDLSNIDIARPYRAPISERLARRLRRAEYEANARMVAERVAEARRSEAVEEMRQRGVPLWVRRIILDVSSVHNVSPVDVLSAKKTVPVRAARDEAIYTVKSTKPMLTCTMIAPWFARDYKTILHSLASHAHKNNLPKLCGYDIDRAWQRMRDRINARRAA